jgi:hypothetical protein
MTDLRKAAEMALEALEDIFGKEKKDVGAINALRQALTPEVTPEVPCKTDPRAPHGFDRNASHSADRYVCECEGWEPPRRQWVGLTDEELGKTVLANLNETLWTLTKDIEAKLKEKNT